METGWTIRRRVEAASQRHALVCVAVLAVLAVAFSLVGPRHSPWFDEAQSWLLARDSDPVQLVLHWGRYEGSPALWQCLLWLYRRLGGPYDGLWTVSAAFALAGAAMVLFAAPFPLWVRGAVSLGYFFAYQYAIVARSYALDLLFAPLAAALFESRRRRPIAYASVLGLMANTNAFGFLIALALTGELATQLRAKDGERRRALLLALGLSAACLVGAFLQVWPAPAMQCRCGWEPMPTRPLLILAAAFVDGPWPFPADAPISTMAGPVITVMLAPPLVALALAAGRARLCAALGGLLLGFVALIHTLAHHAGMIALATLFCLWVSWRAAPRLARDMRAWLTASTAVIAVFHVLGAVGAWSQELTGPPYSPARAAAAALKAQGAVEGAAQIGAIGYTTIAVQPYFDHNIFGGLGGPGSAGFYVWRPGEGVEADVTLDGWARLVRGRRWAWLLAPEPAQPLRGAMDEVARRAGYVRVQTFEAAMIWKTGRTTSGVPRGGDGLQLFRRRDATPPLPRNGV